MLGTATVGPRLRERAVRSARLTWVQHRWALVAFGVATGAVAVVNLLVGLKAHAVWDGLPTCGATKCLDTRASSFLQGGFPPVMSMALRVLPLAAGMFLGAPLVARELESGTFHFTWTQATGRRRAIAVPALVTAIVVAALSLLLGWLFWWASGPFVAQGATSGWRPILFDVGPLTLLGWSVFAYVLGVLIGTRAGRVVAAVAITATVTVALFALIGIVSDEVAFGLFADQGSLAPMYAPPFVSTAAVIPPQQFDIAVPSNAVTLPNAWLVSGRLLGPSGRAMTDVEEYAMNQHMPPAMQGQPRQGRAQLRWLAAHHEQLVVAYQPAGRYWAFQGAAGIVLLALSGGAAVATRRLLERA